jgi:hypothetical protein
MKTKEEKIHELFKDLIQEICSLHPINFREVESELTKLLKVRYNILMRLK